MRSARKAFLFGFLLWLVPFIIAVGIFPLKRAGNPPQGGACSVNDRTGRLA